MIRYVDSNYINGLKLLYPKADYLKEIIIRDVGDGKGPFLEQWNIVNTSPPTDLDVQTVISNPPPPTLDEIELKVLFNHENRIRTLEAKPNITVKQFLTAIAGL